MEFYIYTYIYQYTHIHIYKSQNVNTPFQKHLVAATSENSVSRQSSTVSCFKLHAGCKELPDQRHDFLGQPTPCRQALMSLFIPWLPFRVSWGCVHLGLFLLLPNSASATSLPQLLNLRALPIKHLNSVSSVSKPGPVKLLTSPLCPEMYSTDSPTGKKMYLQGYSLKIIYKSNI